MLLRIEPNGTLRGLYTEDMDLSSVGSLEIHRASHVEPDAAGSWWADCSPVGGPKLGPFVKRSEALTAEVQWIEANCL